MANFSRLSEMKQNQANFATFLSMIWRNQFKPVKYRGRTLTAVEMRVLI